MWVGACTSSIGTWMQQLAQAWLVFDLSKSAFMLGLDNFLGQIPILLFALVAGVVADRVDRRRLLIGSQLVQMASAFILAVLFATGHAEVWHILVLSFLTGTAQSFGSPAYQSLLPSLVPRAHLPNAIAMNSIQFNLARIVGPMIGGVTLHQLGAAWCFGLNGVSFIAVIITLMMIAPGFSPAATKDSMLESMRGGVRFIRTQTGMSALIVASFASTFFGVPIIVFLPVFAKDVYHGNENTYTVLLCVEAAGAIAGALLVAARGKSQRLGREAVISLTLLGGCMAAFALISHYWLALVFLFLGGVTLISCFSLLSSLVQFVATDEMRGRVMSIYNVAFRGGMPLGSLISGKLVAMYSAPLVVAGNGFILLMVGLYLYFIHRKVASL